MDPTAQAEYERFVASTGASLRRTAYLLCGDWARAEDATQDGLVKVYLAWTRLSRGPGLRAYAHRAVTTAVVDQSRRPWRREHPAEELPELVAGDPADPVDRRLLVLAALRRLPPRRRACVVLRFVGDLAVEEVAQALRISPGTVKSQTARGLDQLRADLDLAGLVLDLEER